MKIFQKIQTYLLKCKVGIVGTESMSMKDITKLLPCNFSFDVIS